MGQIHNSISDSTLYYEYLNALSKEDLTFTSILKIVKKSKSIVHRQIKFLLENKYVKYNTEKKKYFLNKKTIQDEFLSYFSKEIEINAKKEINSDFLEIYNDSEIIFFLVKFLMKKTDSTNIREVYNKIITYFRNSSDNDYEHYLEMGDSMLYEDFLKIEKSNDFKVCEKFKQLLSNSEDNIILGLSEFYKKKFPNLLDK